MLTKETKIEMKIKKNVGNASSVFHKYKINWHVVERDYKRNLHP